jgi:crotonobetainyl-CoA:carnitine CoA-transferase CaiB-like acyl-CoA transferase
LKSVGFFKLVEHPSEGQIRIMDVSQRWSQTQPGIRRHAPRIGEHTAEVLREYGYDELEIDQMILTGVAFVPA